MNRVKYIFAALACLVCYSSSLTGAGIDLDDKIKTDTPAKLTAGEPDGFDSAIVVKPDYMINALTDTYGANQVSAVVACDSSGNYGIAWVDYRSGKSEIYAQFYSSSGEKRGRNIKVSEPLTSDNCASPSISTNKKGDFIIVWNKDYNAIIAQRFTSAGEKTGANYQLNSLVLYSIQNPNVVVNEDGSYLVSWIGQTDTYNLYVRLFKYDNSPAFTEYILNDELSVSGDNYGKYTAVDGKGNYIIVWPAPAQDYHYDVYMQIIDKDGNKVNRNVLISGLYNPQNKHYPQVTCTDDGHCLVTWYVDPTESIAGGVRARIYHTSGSFVTGTIDLSSYSSTNNVSISSDTKGIFLLLYGDGKGQKLDTLGKVRSTTQLDLTDNPVEYTGPVITNIVNRVFNCVLMFNNNNRDNDVYVRRFSDNFSPGSSLEKVNDDKFTASQREPLVFFNSLGGSIVIWEDTRNGKNDLYGQVYDEFQNPAGDNLLIYSSSSKYWHTYNKAVRSLKDGTFVIAFSGRENLTNSIYMQMVTPRGELTGIRRLVSTNFDDYYVTLNSNSNDDILVCWYTRIDTYIRKYNKAGSALGESIRLVYDKSRGAVAASVDTSLNVLLAWSYLNSDLTRFGDIYTKMYNSTGNAVADSSKLASTGNPVYDLICALDGGNYAVVWWDYSANIRRVYNTERGHITYAFRDTRNILNYPGIICFEKGKLLIHYQVDNEEVAIYFNDNKEETYQYLLHEYSSNSFTTFNQINSCAVYNNKLFFVYEKAGDTTSYDIWGKILELDKFNLNDESYIIIKNDDYLFNNYPNPFNGSTTIPYKLLSPYHVKLTLYDVLGREVKVLVDEFQEKGLYEIKLDASDLASGVYIYRLDAFKSYVKKLIIMK